MTVVNTETGEIVEVIDFDRASAVAEASDIVYGVAS